MVAEKTHNIGDNSFINAVYGFTQSDNKKKQINSQSEDNFV